MRNIRNLIHQNIQHGFAGNVHNDRIPSRPMLGDEDLLDCHWVKRVSPEPVDRFGRQCHKAAATENGRRTIEGARSFSGIELRRIDLQPECLHSLYCRW